MFFGNLFSSRQPKEAKEASSTGPCDAATSTSSTSPSVSPVCAALPHTLTLPTTLSIPLDGFHCTLELAPTTLVQQGPGGSAASSTNGLQAQIAQQMLAFATQQATLLSQALPFMLNLPPARVTDKLRGLLTEVQAKPALEKLMKATGSSEPMAQRVCIEYINRNGKGRVDPGKMLQFYHAHKGTMDFSRPLTVQDLLKHMDVATCIRTIQERVPGIPHQTAELAATLSMADADAAVQLLTASAAPSALTTPVFLTEVHGELLQGKAAGGGGGCSGGTFALPAVGGPGAGGGHGGIRTPAATPAAGPPCAVVPGGGGGGGGGGQNGNRQNSPDGSYQYPLFFDGAAQITLQHQQQGAGTLYLQGQHGQVVGPDVEVGQLLLPCNPLAPDPSAGLDIAGELKQFTDRLLQLQQHQQDEAAAGTASVGGGSSSPGSSCAPGSAGASASIVLPPSHIDMLSNLVLQSNAAINRYLLERQQLHKDLAMLKKHKEWADSRISDLIKKACETDKPFAEEVRSLREEVKRLRADKEALEARCMEVEEALSGLKESVYAKDSARREAELRLQALEAEVRGAALREAELRMELQEAQSQVKQAAKRATTLERQRTKLGEDRAAEVTAAALRTKEAERMAAAVRAAEKLAKERGEAVEAERAARAHDQRAADLSVQVAEALRASLEAELGRSRQQLAAEGARAEQLAVQSQQLSQQLEAALRQAASAQAEAEAARAGAAGALEVAAVARAEAEASRAQATSAREAAAHASATAAVISTGSSSERLACAVPPAISGPGLPHGGATDRSSCSGAGGLPAPVVNNDAGGKGLRHKNGLVPGAACLPHAWPNGHYCAPDFLGLALAPGASQAGAEGCPAQGIMGGGRSREGPTQQRQSSARGGESDGGRVGGVGALKDSRHTQTAGLPTVAAMGGGGQGAAVALHRNSCSDLGIMLPAQPHQQQQLGRGVGQLVGSGGDLFHADGSGGGLSMGLAPRIGMGGLDEGTDAPTLDPRELVQQHLQHQHQQQQHYQQQHQQQMLVLAQARNRMTAACSNNVDNNGQAVGAQGAATGLGMGGRVPQVVSGLGCGVGGGGDPLELCTAMRSLGALGGSQHLLAGGGKGVPPGHQGPLMGMGVLGGGGAMGQVRMASLGAFDAFGHPVQLQHQVGQAAVGQVLGHAARLGHIAGPPTNEALLRQLELLRQM